MKKLIVAAVLFTVVSCSNPEDRATGDPDSTSFNSNDKNNTNSRDFNNAAGSAMNDTSAAPAVDKKNATSPTQGTNRIYGADSSKK